MPKNLESFKAVYSFGNSQKSDKAKPGKYGGLSNFITDVLVKQSLTASAQEAEPLS
jgi:hypothetical protein